MQWIQHFDLFLFDFDGLLVNTEELHCEAYRQMCQGRGYSLDWSLFEFFEAAHFSSTGLRDAIYREFPELQKQEPRWDVLYAEKKHRYQALLEKGEPGLILALMPGVTDVLVALEKTGKRRCVVTNSPKVQVDLIKEKVPLLNTIPVWITRENYREPKPHPECYLTAIRQLGKPGDRVIGFEDSTRGFQALTDAGVRTALLIAPQNHPQMKTFKGTYFPSFNSIIDLH
ncbi:MAG TPA: HAD family phosphatase [Rhabdochlamydiaceae bacterium]|nr:HAD family phosphatase [Rhabdochlamydiaceae bacterium]